MNQNIYKSAYYSLFVQFIIAIICLLGTFIKLNNEDQILYELLVLETVVQIIQFSFYLWLVFNFSNIKIDISIVRYYDWFFTTPIMLFSLICFMIYIYNKNNFLPTEDLSLVSIYNGNSNILTKIIISNSLMLILGYLGELNVISKAFGFVSGTLLLFYVFYYIYITFVQEESVNKFLFWFNFIVWSGYGIAYLLSHKNKNTIYNILDVFSKNINSLFILLFIFFKYY
jgi:hypothetical protein